MDTTLAAPATKTAIRVSAATLAGVGISLVAFIAYFFTLTPTVYFVDGGELTTATYTLGITHPPGYPLYTLLGWAFTHLPLGEDIAWRLNLLSAIFAAAATGVFYALVYNTLRLVPLAMSGGGKATRAAATAPQARRKPRKGESPRAQEVAKSSPAPVRSSATISALSPTVLIIFATAAAGLFAFGLAVWSWAVQAKMYTLQWLLVGAIFLAALLVNRAADEPTEGNGYFGTMPPKVRRLHTFAFLLGLGFTNHATTALLVPGLLILVLGGSDWLGRLMRYLRYLPTLLPTFLLPLALYIYLPLRSAQEPLMNWGTPWDWPNFARHVSGWQYGNILFQPLADALGRNLRQWVIQFDPILGAVVALIAIVGLVRLAQRDRVLFSATLLAAILSSIFAFTYGIREIEAYHVAFYMMALLWLGVGLTVLYQWASARLEAKNAKLAVALVALLLPIAALAINWPKSDHHNDYIALRYTENAFKGFEPNALVITDQWDFASTTYYAQYILGERPDLAILDLNLMKYPWYMHYIERQHPDLIALVGDVEKTYRAEQEKFVNGKLDLNNAASTQLINESYLTMLQGMVQKSLPNRPVYALFALVERGAAKPDSIQAAVLGQYYHPEGMAYRIDSAAGKFDVKAPEWDLRGITSEAVPRDYIAVTATAVYPAVLNNIGNYMIQNGRTEEGRQLLDEAQRLIAILSLKE